MSKILFLDCDSTLSTIEGIDELAACRGSEIQQQVVELTNGAMSGQVPIDEVFARRLDLIQPTFEMCQEVGRKYVATITDNGKAVLDAMRQQGWKPVIVSGGFTEAIRPLAGELGIEEVFAVSLRFNSDGTYQNFDRSAPTARNHGKTDVIRHYCETNEIEKSVMIGDGISDWETHTVVDLFVGFGGVVERQSVKERATEYLACFQELPHVVSRRLGKVVSV